MQFATAYDITDKVIIDRDGSLVGVITAVKASGSSVNVTYLVEWFNSGRAESAWFEEWRLNRWVE